MEGGHLVVVPAVSPRSLRRGPGALRTLEDRVHQQLHARWPLVVVHGQALAQDVADWLTQPVRVHLRQAALAQLREHTAVLDVEREHTLEYHVEAKAACPYVDALVPVSTEAQLRGTILRVATVAQHAVDEVL